jgi:hypothetical protein
MTSFRLGLLAGLVLPLGLATAGLAQTAPQAPPPPAADAAHHHHMDPAARRAWTADYLRGVLQLTPAQDPALNAFLDAMQPPQGGMHREDHGQEQALSTPAKLDKMLARMDEMRSRLATRVAAVKTFYAQLTPSQQKAFDDLAPLLTGAGRAMHRMEMFRHRDGPPGGGDHPMGPGGPPQG